MKVVIIGNAGSGKTWLAKQLGAKLAIPTIHLDEVVWHSNTFDRKRTSDDVSRLVSCHLTQNEWIVEGVFGDIASYYLKVADRLVWLNPTWQVCLHRLTDRWAQAMAREEKEASIGGLDRLLVWAGSYNTRTGGTSESTHRVLYEMFLGEKEILTEEEDVVRYISNA